MQVSESIYIPPRSIEEVPVKKRGKVKRVIKAAVHALRTGRGIHPLGQGSVNHVYRIYKLNHVIGYLKFGEAGNEATTVLERIAWKISLIVGLSDYFTATVPLVIRDPRSISVPFPKGSKGERGERVVATVQPRRVGKDLEECDKIFLKNGPKCFTYTMQVTIAALTLGMWDWHEDNGVVSKKGKLKFFDNGRCLPHENSLIRVSEVFLSPFKFTPLGFSDFHRTLSAKEQNFLLQEVRRVLKQIPQVIKYLDTGEDKEVMEQIPAEWLDPKRAVAAMKERLYRMETALVEGKVTSLVSLVCFVFPYCRFIASLSAVPAIQRIPGGESHAELAIMSMGHWAINALLDWASSEGVNVEEILEESFDFNLPFDQLIARTINKVDLSSDQPEEVAKARVVAFRVFKRLREESYEEFKDFGSSEMGKQMHQIVTQKAHQYGVHVLQTIEGLRGRIVFEKLSPLEIVLERCFGRHPQYCLSYWDHDGEKCFKTVRYYYPSFFEVEGEEDQTPKFFSEIIEAILPPFYFPKVDSRSKAFKILCRDQWLLGKGKEKGNYAVYYTESEYGAVKKRIYTHSKSIPGMLENEIGRIYTLNQLASYWSSKLEPATS